MSLKSEAKKLRKKIAREFQRVFGNDPAPAAVVPVHVHQPALPAQHAPANPVNPVNNNPDPAVTVQGLTALVENVREELKAANESKQQAENRASEAETQLEQENQKNQEMKRAIDRNQNILREKKLFKEQGKQMATDVILRHVQPEVISYLSEQKQLKRFFRDAKEGQSITYRYIPSGDSYLSPMEQKKAFIVGASAQARVIADLCCERKEYKTVGQTLEDRIREMKKTKAQFLQGNRNVVMLLGDLVAEKKPQATEHGLLSIAQLPPLAEQADRKDNKHTSTTTTTTEEIKPGQNSTAASTNPHGTFGKTKQGSPVIEQDQNIKQDENIEQKEGYVVILKS